MSMRFRPAAVVATVARQSKLGRRSRGPNVEPSAGLRRGGSEEQPNARQFQAGVLTCLGGLCCFTYVAGKSSPLGRRDTEDVWLGRRGPLSDERAVAWLPMGMCLGSGLVAASIRWRFPSRIEHVALNGQLHDVLSLPLAILIAFRFQNAYDRWWSSRHCSEEIASDIVALAVLVSSGKANGRAEVKRERARFFALLDAYAGFTELKINGPGFRPHPSNDVPDWQSPWEALKDYPADLAAAQSVAEPIVWCSSAIVSCVTQLQSKTALTGEEASAIYERIVNLEHNVGKCAVVCQTQSPAPFVVHLRTLLLMFCFTFPFSILSQKQPFLIFLGQMGVSFAFLGTEFCSREMEHPFGDDRADVPFRRILANARARVMQQKAFAV